jgi:hypothetical protein
MQYPFRWPFGAILMSGAILLAGATAAHGEGLQAAAPRPGAETLGDGGAPYWRVFLSPYTYHWQYNPQHRPVWAIGAERQFVDDWVAGGTYFRNSFDQPCAYLYAGKRWEGVLGQPRFFVQLTAGLLYGYRGEFASKVPFNHNGYSPGAVASLGWHLNRRSEIAINLLGSAAVMYQYSFDLR